MGKTTKIVAGMAVSKQGYLDEKVVKTALAEGKDAVIFAFAPEQVGGGSLVFIHEGIRGGLSDQTLLDEPLDNVWGYAGYEVRLWHGEVKVEAGQYKMLALPVSPYRVKFSPLPLAELIVAVSAAVKEAKAFVPMIQGQIIML